CKEGMCLLQIYISFTEVVVLTGSIFRSAVTVDREEMQVRLTESRKEEDADGSPEELNWMGCRWNSRQYRKHRKFRSKKL
uniref:Uncharacterized protein n=1 Tax=Parascaris univalens TaxID=6257 RepID=A0A915AY42_PARUN